MTIVFGSGSFLLKKFRPEDIGLHEKVENGYMIERRQGFVHIFWIPICSTGKVWYASSKNNRYQLPQRYEHLIVKDKAKAKGKWYAYSLPLLILLIAFGAGCISVFERYMSYRGQMERKVAEQNVFENPLASDTYRFSDENYKDFVLTVKTVEPSRIIFEAPVMKDSAAYGKKRFFTDSTQAIVIDRSDLKQLFVWKYTEYQEPGTLKIPHLKPLTNYKVKLFNVRRQNSLYRY